MEKTINEFRGCRNLVAALVTKNTSEELTFGEVFPVAGLAELSRDITVNTKTSYYDDVASNTSTSEGEDKLTCKVSALSLEVLAKLTGRDYDADLDALGEGPINPPLLALGYMTGETGSDGENSRYVWRYCCKCSIPAENYKTKDDTADTNGQDLILTSIYPNKEITFNGKTKKWKSLVVGTRGSADLSTFFDQVTLPDELTAKAAEQVEDGDEEPQG